MATISHSGWDRNALESATEIPPQPIMPMQTLSLGATEAALAPAEKAKGARELNVRREIPDIDASFL
jgi:hypothetical protein